MSLERVLAISNRIAAGGLSLRCESELLPRPYTRCAMLERAIEDAVQACRAPLGAPNKGMMVAAHRCESLRDGNRLALFSHPRSADGDSGASSLWPRRYLRPGARMNERTPRFVLLLPPHCGRTCSCRPSKAAVTGGIAVRT